MKREEASLLSVKNSLEFQLRQEFSVFLERFRQDLIQEDLKTKVSRLAREYAHEDIDFSVKSKKNQGTKAE